MQKIIEEHGDIDCVEWIDYDYWDDASEGWFEPYSDDPIEFVSDFAYSYTDTNGNKQYTNVNSSGYIDGQRETVFVVKEL
ncbi:hypothetical protein JOC34_000626 [Virgibacillus halotolerans]|uniref:hypothetical protein n=1 Tax=Virgibacillus halotolerans TaxID=1071053 RepID=UPI00196051B8|nr:hypothetical protein [Virgibacillus halotolerans]MBM7598269.1 hypothetical protein [Virgibacillus halotolerans]